MNEPNADLSFSSPQRPRRERHLPGFAVLGALTLLLASLGLGASVPPADSSAKTRTAAPRETPAKAHPSKEKSSMTTRATADFKIDSWEQSLYDEPAEGPQLGRATVKKSFHGDLEGTSTAELLMCGSPGGDAGYIASEKFTGTLAGRKGTFVMQHGGLAWKDGRLKPFGNVVPGSGTGELVGLSGTLEYRHDEKGAVLTLDYRFE